MQHRKTSRPKPQVYYLQWKKPNQRNIPGQPLGQRGQLMLFTNDETTYHGEPLGQPSGDPDKPPGTSPVSYTHLRAHETGAYL
eukprot:9009865-Pyramimonas_sp.AAC.1